MRRSVVLIVTLCAMLFAPCAFAAGPGATDLSWTDSATNEAGFRVERADASCTPVPTTFLEIADLPANATGYRNTTTALGNRYCYRIRAYNFRYVGDPESAQYSGYSNIAEADYPLPPAAAPTGLSAQ